MKTNVNFDDFIKAFLIMGRENQFSYEGKKALKVALKISEMIKNDNKAKNK